MRRFPGQHNRHIRVANILASCPDGLTSAQLASRMDVRVATFFEDSKPSEARYNALTKFIR